MKSKFSHLERLEHALNDRFGKKSSEDIPQEWSNFPLAWLCYGQRETSIREASPMWSDYDVMSDIIDLFDSYHRSLVDEITEKAGIESGDKNFISVYVQPDFENQCTVLIVQRGMNNVVYLSEMKARHLWFDTPEEMETDLEDEYKDILRGVR